MDDTANILAALAACTPKQFVSMSGNFTVTSAAQLYGTHIGNVFNTTLRGLGPMSTSITLNAGGLPIQFGAFADGGGGNITNLAANPLGQTSFVVSNVTGTASLVANNVAYINQEDNGYTCTVPIPQGATCTGSSVDTGSVFFCQHDPLCNDSSHTGGGQHHSEEQALRIVSATNNGNGTWTIVTDPGLYMPDWSSSRGATLRWNTSGFTVYGMGIEDMTIRVPDNGGSGDNMQIQTCVGCWVKGVRFIGPNNTAQLLNHNCLHCLVMNNYFFGESNTFVGSSLENEYTSGEDGDTLILNNIGDGGMFNDDDFDMHQGIVMAYNYARDVDTNHYQSTQFEHEAGSALMLREANQFGRINDDATWSSHNFNTMFRNNLDCGDFPYQISGQSGGGIQVSSFSRFSNLVGNVIGINVPSSYLTGGSTKCTAYEIQADDGAAYNVNGHTPFDGFNGTTGSVSLTKASLLRWGNVTTNGTTTTTSFNSSENPSNLSNYPNATSYANVSTPSQNLPCSFFMQSFLPKNIAVTGTTCTPSSAGHTGLSWWKTCDTWTIFPTSCGHYTVPPFPAAGPDVTGFANDIPSAVAWKNLPIDTTFQNSFTITASSWSSGTETLTVSGLPALFNFLGGFQLSGVSTNNCFPGATPAELLMTGSSATQVLYALSADPGANACTGTLKWPDIRQFDERVFATDPPTPGVAYYTACPNSSSLNSGSWGGTPPFDYNCLVDPSAMIAGNTLLVSIAFDSTGGGQTWSVVDDKGDTFTQIASSATTNNKQMLVFEATNIAGGETRIDMRLTGTVNGFWQPTVLEVFNAAAVDATSCNAGASSTSITAGSLTPTVTGDFLYQVLYYPNLSQGTPAQSAAYTAGSQSNINWALWFELLEDGAAGQWGVYNSTSAINPTFTAASSQTAISCGVALQAATTGGPNPAAQRVNGIELDAKPTLGSNIPWKLAANVTGHTVYVTTMTNAIVNPTTCCAISSSPALTWTQSGADGGGTNGHNHSDVYCATSTGVIGPLTMTLNFSSPGTNDGIFVVYDVDGWGCTLDVDSGVQSGVDSTDLIPPLCVNCLTPTVQGDFIVGNMGEAFNTVVGINTQTNATFVNDSCYNTFTNINGSSQACENNGFFHGTNGNSTSSITFKPQDASGAQGGSPPQNWAGRLAAFRPLSTSSAIISFSPNPVSFVNQVIGSVSTVLSLTVNNVGGSSLVLSSPYDSITGTNAGDFSDIGTGTCTNGGSVAASSSCTINLRYAPKVIGSESATLTINGNVSGSVSLFGIGTNITLAPQIFAFGEIR